METMQKWKQLVALECLTLFRVGLFGTAHEWGSKKSPFLKSVTHIQQR